MTGQKTIEEISEGSSGSNRRREFGNHSLLQERHLGHDLHFQISEGT